MNLLGGYESSGDDEKEQSDDRKTTKQTLSSSSSSSSATSYTAVDGKSHNDGVVTTKKRKATFFSTLPIEIQNALVRGSTSQDSDSDDELSGTKTVPVKERKPLKSGGSLIDLLPRPKAATSDVIKGGNTSASRPPLRVPVTREDVVRIPKSSAIAEGDIDSGNNNDSDDDQLGSTVSAVTQQPKGESMFSLSAPMLAGASKGIGKPSSLGYSGPFAASSLGSAYTSFENITDETASLSSNSYRPATSSSMASLAPFSSSRYDSSESSSSIGPGPGARNHYDDASEDVTEPDYGNGSIARKRRERDIEQQLISGNLDAIQSGNGGIKEVRAGKDWDAHAYTTQKENEAELHRAFFAAKGGAKAIAPVSKMQGRKHQINSLVMQAAKTELALLNAKGERNLSKQETRGKYGW
jgi:Mitotic checkpoint regulator, MAD2B-interacting